MPNPLFLSTSTEQPTVINIAIPNNSNKNKAENKNGLGIKLKNHDKGSVQDMFKPSYVSVQKILDDGEVANVIMNHENNIVEMKKLNDDNKEDDEDVATIKEGDYIVAVNGIGFRRFKPDYNTFPSITISSTAAKTTSSSQIMTSLPNSPTPSMDEGDISKSKKNDNSLQLLSRVLSGEKDGKSYSKFIQCIKEAQNKDNNGNGSTNNDGKNEDNNNNNPSSSKEEESPSSLILTLERFSWDARANSWERFLSIQKSHKNKNKLVQNAMKMLQEHEFWKDATFPIDLTSLSLQLLLKSNAISELCLHDNDNNNNNDDHNHHYPILWINFSTIVSLLTNNITTATNNNTNTTTMDETILSKAFIIYIETLLINNPKQIHFIDLSGVCLSSNDSIDIFQSILLQYVYNKIIQPNYPNILHKLIFFPISFNNRHLTNAILSYIDSTLFVDKNNDHDPDNSFVIATDDLKLVCKELNLVINDVLKHGGLAYLHQHLHVNSAFIFD